MFVWFGSKEYAEIVELVNNTRHLLDEILENQKQKVSTECGCGVRLLNTLEQFDYNQKYEKRLLEYQDTFNDLLHRVTDLEVLVKQKITEIDNSLFIIMVKYIM